MIEQNAAPTESIDSTDFSVLLMGCCNSYSGIESDFQQDRATLIAHIDRHTREAVQAALEEAARSIDQIDDGGAPAYRHCQEHIRTLATKKEQANG